MLKKTLILASLLLLSACAGVAGQQAPCTHCKEHCAHCAEMNCTDCKDCDCPCCAEDHGYKEHGKICPKKMH